MKVEEEWIERMNECDRRIDWVEAGSFFNCNLPLPLCTNSGIGRSGFFIFLPVRECFWRSQIINSYQDSNHHHHQYSYTLKAVPDSNTKKMRLWNVLVVAAEVGVDPFTFLNPLTHSPLSDQQALTWPETLPDLVDQTRFCGLIIISGSDSYWPKVGSVVAPLYPTFRKPNSCHKTPTYCIVCIWIYQLLASYLIRSTNAL